MRLSGPTAPLRLPASLQNWLEQAAQAQLRSKEMPGFDFSQPEGEPALASADSVSWQVFKNPLSLFVGGVAAVILELAEPRVRAGVWDHTSFRREPELRLQRTGLAAMVTVYGARSSAEPMIAAIRRMHDRVRGTTSSGTPYHANDPELLRWVHATAAFGFVEAYHTYVRQLSRAERDRYYRESVPVSRLYGAEGAPTNEADLKRLFENMVGHLEPSDVVFEFLRIMQEADVLPHALRPVQRLLVRAAVEITPAPIRSTLGLGRRYGLQGWEVALVKLAGRMADRIVLASSPAVQACLRLHLPADYLYRR